MREKLISDEEVKRAIQAFLQHPDRLEKGGTSDEMIKIVNWVGEIKLSMLLNKTILKEIYNGNLLLDINNDGEVVMAYKNEPNEYDLTIEEFLSGDLDDYPEESNG
jgi:hypothetical protein